MLRTVHGLCAPTRVEALGLAQKLSQTHPILPQFSSLPLDHPFPSHNPTAHVDTGVLDALALAAHSGSHGLAPTGCRTAESCT
jgi:hypothetical protein